MKILFLGTGGGRRVMLSQRRRTAGMLLMGSLTFHLDPGPYALNAYRECRKQPVRVDGILISHAHLDHVNDLNLVVEATTLWGSHKKVLFGSLSVIEGDDRFDRVLTRYHKGMLERVRIMKPGDTVKHRKAKIKATGTIHSDGTGVGFIIDMDGKRIGYSGDTEYFPGLGRQFDGCDVIIFNTLQPRGSHIPTHLGTEGAVRALLEMRRKPKLTIIQHFGIGMLKVGPSKEAEYIERKVGVRTVAAEDGMMIKEEDWENRKLTEF